MALEPDATFGPYRIVRKLGEGGMGTVWEGVHERLKKRVAIKTLHATVASSAEAVARFMREGEAAAKLHHAHVVGVTDVGVYDDTPVLVMELLVGESLAARIARDGPLDAATLVELALPVMDALGAAHAEGIVHRDLKPENIFLKKARGRALHPVVLDFGISKLEGSDAKLTKTASFVGTPHYMSPEQARGSKDVGARSDQYSLGLVLFEAGAGKRAIESDVVLEIVHMIATGDVPKLALARPDLPQALTSAIDRMLALKAGDRFPSLVEAGAAMLPFASARTTAVWSGAFGGETGSIPPPPPSERAAPDLATKTDTRTPYATHAKPRARASWRAGIVTAVALATITITAVAIGSQRQDAAAPTVHAAIVETASPPPAEPEAPTLARGVDMPAEPLPSPIEQDADAPIEGVTEPVAITTAPHVRVAPATPTRGQIREAVDRIAPIARACGRIMHGPVMVSFTVHGATGHVSEIEVVGSRPNAALEQCVARAFVTAQFHTFTQPAFRVRYPLAL